MDGCFVTVQVYNMDSMKKENIVRSINVCAWIKDTHVSLRRELEWSDSEVENFLSFAANSACSSQSPGNLCFWNV